MPGLSTPLMKHVPDQLKQPLTQLLLSLADDKLVLGHRNSDWTGLGPILEEDIAFSHLAQDEIAHAQAIYQFLGEMSGRSADDLAFGRPPEEFRCAQLVEVPDEFDWATAICRQLFCDHFDAFRLNRLAESTHKPLADLAKRIGAEEALHVEHSTSWVIRLGRGTDESRARMQQAMDHLSPLAPMLWEMTDGQQALADAGIYPGCGPELFDEWRAKLKHVAQQAGLKLELKPPDPKTRDGRRGVHSLHLTELLDEMCEVWRLEPGAKW